MQEPQIVKQQRRAWSVEEKVAALDHLHLVNDNKRRAVRDLAIPSPKMLRSWLVNEERLRDACAHGPKTGAKRLSSAHTLNTSVPTPVPSKFPQALQAAGDAGGAPSSLPCTAAGPARSSFSAHAPTSALASAVPAASLKSMVHMWLEEDCSGFDYGGALVGSAETTAILYAKSPGMLAGCIFFDAVFNYLGCRVAWSTGACDGAKLNPPEEHRGRVEIAHVTGPTRLLLQGERVALNVLAECSGIATAAARIVTIARAAAWPGRIAGTRKTTPGFRLVQKYGMLVGGMDTHRMDLSSMVMAKDNHIAAAGGITGAVSAARAIAGFSLKIDVECGTYEQAVEAARAGADIVMLDNFSPTDFIETARRVRADFPSIIIEGSGGLNEDTVASYFCDEANILSFSVNRYAQVRQ
jgi:nicotinate-nucleotide pyrophosphorylase (carboxylating)